MAKFTGKIKAADGTSRDIPAQTCPTCRGIGYLTGPLAYMGKRKGETEYDIHRAKSGDRCPLCVGRGWVGMTGTFKAE